MDSLRLLLEDYLGLMREEGELDVFLPILLSAMGHTIVLKPQKGTRQYGVDATSVGIAEDGQRSYFMWLIKCGDIGRAEWALGNQAVQPSMEEVGSVHLELHVPPELASLPKRLIVLTNGDFLSAIAENRLGAAKVWERLYGGSVSYVNGSELAAWTESSLLNEYVLTSPSRQLFRRLLAHVGAIEVALPAGMQLVNDLMATIRLAEASKNAKRKRLLTVLRAMRTTLVVLQTWAQKEEDFQVSYRLSEYALLRVWQEIHPELLATDDEVQGEYHQLLAHLIAVASRYHDRLTPYYRLENAFETALPDSLFVANRVFEEVGRLGLQGCIAAYFAASEGEPGPARWAEDYAVRLEMLLQSHHCSGSPAFDHQTVDVHAGLLLLLATERRQLAQEWVQTMVARLWYVVSGATRFRPISGLFEDALLIRNGYEQPNEDYFLATTYVPLLLVWTAALKLHDEYIHLRDKLLPKLGKSTLNFWTPGPQFDTLVGDAGALSNCGAAETPLRHDVGEPEEFLQRYARPLTALPGIDQAPWYQLRAAYIPLLASLFWRVQLPREMIVKQALALTRLEGVPAAAS